MKIHRFIGNFDLSKKDFEIKDKEIVNQMKNVLRLKVGEKVELCDGKHISVIALICKIEKNSIIVSIKEMEEDKNKTKNNVTLFCAVLKKENFELVVQKATECGVLKIVPIISERTIKTGLNMERLRKIAKEASEQCGRVNIPEILEPVSFDESLKLINEKNINIIFDISGESLGGLTAKLENINIFIGPEGGWTEKEIAEAKNLNFKIATLGPLTLRGETAAIVATYLISSLE
ncbi:MAG: RsmE family RNA methyltransferase [bacterium]